MLSTGVSSPWLGLRLSRQSFPTKHLYELCLHQRHGIGEQPGNSSAVGENRVLAQSFTGGMGQLFSKYAITSLGAE